MDTMDTKVMTSGESRRVQNLGNKLLFEVYAPLETKTQWIQEINNIRTSRGLKRISLTEVEK